MVGARHNIKPYPLTSEPAGKLNVSDPDSRNLKATRGWVQGYNAQAVVGEGQIILAAEIGVESLDTANLAADDPDRRRRAPGGRRHRDAPGVVLADAGYWTNDAIDALCGEGIPTGCRPRRRPPQRAGRAAAAGPMTSRGASWRPTGRRHFYLKRHGTVEPVFGQIKSNRGADRLPAPRQISGQIGMAAADRDPQPPQAPPTPTRHRLSVGGSTRPSGLQLGRLNQPAPMSTRSATTRPRRTHTPFRDTLRAREHSATDAAELRCRAGKR